MKTVQIFYSKYEKKISQSLYKKLLNQLPLNLQEQNNKFLRWQDRHANLFGKLLLIEGLKYNGYGANYLDTLRYNKYKRPYLDLNIDFNISHSGEYVICAIGNDIKLGIDIEKVVDIDFNDFIRIMTIEQWNKIYSSSDSKQLFFKYWAIKESVIKADGRGLSISLLDINIDGHEVNYENKKWYLNDIDIIKGYKSCLATNLSKVSIKMNYINFYENKLINYCL